MWRARSTGDPRRREANLLAYAYHPRAEQHEHSRAWLEAVLSGPDLVRFAWLTLWAFLRIATNPRVFERSNMAPRSARRIATSRGFPGSNGQTPSRRTADRSQELSAWVAPRHLHDDIGARLS
jgi:predicted nucleic acid-binding protein